MFDFTGDNVLFVYNSNNADSLALATYYSAKRGVPAGQLLGVNCTSTEVLANYAAFQVQVETPLLAALAALSGVYIIVLGYDVPGGFYDGVDVVSSVSRISNILTPYLSSDKNKANFFFQQKSETLFEPGDESYAYLVSRIDGPTYEDAKSIIDKATEILNQDEVNGNLYVDPYFGISNSNYLVYQNNLIKFAATISPLLNMPLNMTNFKDPYTDVPFACLEDDSFYWGGLSDRATSTYFRNTDTSRVFFYNADTISATSVRSASGTYWTIKSILSGYASSAGTMSPINPAQFLDATQFFTSFLYGGTLAEAFLYGLPYLNSPVTLIGDPLLTVQFPAYNVGAAKSPNLLCDVFGSTAAPYSITLNIEDILFPCFQDQAIASPTFGDIFIISRINTDINWIYTINNEGNCQWEKILPGAISVAHWISPITHLSPCTNIPSGAEGTLTDYDVRIVITSQKVLSSASTYSLGVKIESTDGTISIFDGELIYLINNGIVNQVINNNNQFASIDNTTGVIVLGTVGTITISNVYYVGNEQVTNA